MMRLENELKQIVTSPAFRTRVESQGADVVSSDPRELEAFLKTQLAGYRKTALAAGIKAE